MLIMKQNFQDLRTFGQEYYFEYHCLESHDSSDAIIWYRSHQKVKVLRFADCDAIKCESDGLETKDQRASQGMQILYTVRFEDELEWDVFEDELLDSPDSYQRPDPPKSVALTD